MSGRPDPAGHTPWVPPLAPEVPLRDARGVSFVEIVDRMGDIRRVDHDRSKACPCWRCSQARAEAWGRGAAIGLITGFLVAMAIGWLIATRIDQAPRSGPDPTAQVDVSLGASGPASSTAPPYPDGRGADAAAHETPDAMPSGLASEPGRPPRLADRWRSFGAGGGIGSPSFSMRGLATYYPACRLCAAASGELQHQLGPHWKGQWVTVSHGPGPAVRVRLVTGCACGMRMFHGHLTPTVIDLSPWAFGQLASQGTGVIRVLVVAGELGVLPPTDTVR